MVPSLRTPVRLAAALAAASLAACGTWAWTHPGKLPEVFHAERLACEQQAVSMYPVVIVPRMTAPPRATPTTTTCTQQGPQQVCTSVPGTVLPPRWVNEDVNASSRSRVRDDCLRANGWTYRRID